MKRFIILAGLIILLFLVLIWIHGTSLSLAEIPRMINYQGMLTNDSGDPLDGDFDLYFRIYNASSGGDKRWEENHPVVSVSKGLFNVILGSQSGGIYLDFSEEYWLEVEVDNDTMPRLQFTSVGYAYRARVADSAAVAGSGGGGGGWADDGTVVRLDNAGDSVGIGTTDPDYKLDVRSSGTAIYGRTTGGPWNMGLYGRAEVNGFGILGSSTSGHAVHGVTASGYAGYFDGPKSYFSGNLGINTTEPDAMVEIHGSEAGQLAFLELQTSHATQFQETGIRFKTPAHTWYFRMDGYNHNNLPDTGSLSLRSHTTGELMIWTPDGDVGIGTTEPDAKLEVNGDLKVTGAYKGNITSSSGSDGAPFPRPAYNSGWLTLAQGSDSLLTHNIGGDSCDYVVDIQFWDSSRGINIVSYGGYSDDGSHYGAWYDGLTTHSIRIFRLPNDQYADKVRVRIWVYE